MTYVDRGAPVFRFAAPDGWTLHVGTAAAAEAAAGAEGVPTPPPWVVSLKPQEPAGVMWVGLWSPVLLADIEGPDAAPWVRALGGLLLDDATIEAARIERVNGRPARVYAGRGRVIGPDGEAREILFDLALVQVAPGRVAAAAFLGEAAAWEAHGAALRRVLTSVGAAR